MSISIPGYVIVKKVAEGGSAEIYKARRQPYNTDVALKVLRPRYLDNKKRVRAFEQEAEILELCDHPRIIKFHRLVRGGSRVAIDLELFSPTHLKRFAARAAEAAEAELMPLEQTSRVLLQVLDGLAYLHNQDIVHKDLKPENVLVNKQEEVKLIDFSIAVKIKRGFFAKLFAKEPKPEGTPTYLSPEQILSKPVDQRADIYSFSVMAFELLCGRAPITGTSMNELLNAHVSKPAPQLRSINPKVPEELAKLIDRGLLKDPEHRPVSVEPFAAAFQKTC